MGRDAEVVEVLHDGMPLISAALATSSSNKTSLWTVKIRFDPSAIGVPADAKTSLFYMLGDLVGTFKARMIFRMSSVIADGHWSIVHASGQCIVPVKPNATMNVPSKEANVGAAWKGLERRFNNKSGRTNMVSASPSDPETTKMTVLGRVRDTGKTRLARVAAVSVAPAVECVDGEDEKVDEVEPEGVEDASEEEDDLAFALRMCL